MTLQTIWCDHATCHRIAFVGVQQETGPGTYYYCANHVPELRGRNWWHCNREPENRLHWILTDESYAAKGAVVLDGGRWIGHDTSGAVIFNRKDYAGAVRAAEGKGLRCVARGYYGVGSPYEMKGQSAPERMRARVR